MEKQRQKRGHIKKGVEINITKLIAHTKAQADYYKGSFYSFINDPVAAITGAGDNAFITAISIPNTCTAAIVAALDSHNNVLQLTHDGGGGNPAINHSFPAAQITGTFEFYIASSDITRVSSFLFRESTVEKIEILIKNSLIQHYPNNVETSSAVVPVNNNLNHIKVTFDCSAGVNGQYQLYIDTVQIGGDHEMMAAATSLDELQLTNTTAAAYSCYLEAYGNIARSDYSVGDNATLYDDPLIFRRALSRFGTHCSFNDFSAYDIEKMLFLP